MKIDSILKVFYKCIKRLENESKRLAIKSGEKQVLAIDYRIEADTLYNESLRATRIQKKLEKILED